MPTFEISAPDGTKYHVEGPDGATEEQALAQVQAAHQPAQPSTGMDIAKQAGAGLIRGAEAIPTAPAALLGLAGKGLNYLAPGLFDQGKTAQQEDLRKQIQGVGGGSIEQYLPKAQTPVGEAVSNIASFLPSAAMAPGGLARNLALGATAGTGSELAGQAAKGTPYETPARLAGALAAPVAAGAASRAITPLPMAAARQPAVQALENEGINLTAGQRTGSRPLQYFEQALGDIPGAGRGAAAATERSSEQFTGAVLRRAGVDANRATPEVMDQAFTRIGNQFDTLAARNTMHPDAQFGHDLQNAMTDYHSLVAPPNRAPAILDFMSELGTTLQRNKGTIPGEAFQSLSSRIERAARAARGQPEVAGTLRDMRGALNDAMERSIKRSGNMADLGAWRETRNQYRNMLTIERAATGAGENAALGLISPSALRNATVAQGRRAYARGQGDFGELARSGEAVMRPMPQSGTAPRSYAQHLPSLIGATLGGMAGGIPGAAMGGAAAIAGPPLLGRALMSRPVQAYLGNQLMANHAQLPAAQRALRQALISFPALRGILPIQDQAR